MCSNLIIEEENPWNFTFEKLECVEKNKTQSGRKDGQKIGIQDTIMKIHVIIYHLIWSCRRECVHLWTCVASLWGSRVLHGGPSAAGSPWPLRWTSGSSGSPSPHLETRSHHGGSRGWWEAAGCAQEPFRIRWRNGNLMHYEVSNSSI